MRMWEFRVGATSFTYWDWVFFFYLLVLLEGDRSHLRRMAKLHSWGRERRRGRWWYMCGQHHLLWKFGSRRGKLPHEISSFNQHRDARPNGFIFKTTKINHNSNFDHQYPQHDVTQFFIYHQHDVAQRYTFNSLNIASFMLSNSKIIVLILAWHEQRKMMYI